MMTIMIFPWYYGDSAVVMIMLTVTQLAIMKKPVEIIPTTTLIVLQKFIQLIRQQMNTNILANLMNAAPAKYCKIKCSAISPVAQ